MKKSVTIFFQVIVVLVGITTLVFMLWEPQIEGRNVNATLYQIYFNDLFLACVYVVSIAFFVSLHKVFRVLGYARQNKTFSEQTLKALQAIKYCATFIVGAVLVAEGYLFIVRPGDDIAGGVFMGLLMIAVFGITASVAGRFEKKVRNVLEAK